MWWASPRSLNLSVWHAVGDIPKISRIVQKPYAISAARPGLVFRIKCLRQKLSWCMSAWVCLKYTPRPLRYEIRRAVLGKVFRQNT